MVHKFNPHKQMSNIKSVLLQEFPRIREDKVLPTILNIIEEGDNPDILVFYPQSRSVADSGWPHFRAIEQKLEQLGKPVTKKNCEHLWSGSEVKINVYPAAPMSMRGVFGKHIFIPMRTPDITILECVVSILIKYSDTKVYMVDDMPSCQKYGHCPPDSGCELEGHQEKL
jgi:hypothetical protein